jgi:hypothetical protein
MGEHKARPYNIQICQFKAASIMALIALEGNFPYEVLQDAPAHSPGLRIKLSQQGLNDASC